MSLFSKNANLQLTRGESCGIIIDVAGNARRATMESAAVAHLVERHLAKVEVASSSLVGRSNMKPSFVQRCTTMAFFNRNCIKC